MEGTPADEVRREFRLPILPAHDTAGKMRPQDIVDRASMQLDQERGMRQERGKEEDFRWLKWERGLRQKGEARREAAARAAEPEPVPERRDVEKETWRQVAWRSAIGGALRGAKAGITGIAVRAGFAPDPDLFADRPDLKTDVAATVFLPAGKRGITLENLHEQPPAIRQEFLRRRRIWDKKEQPAVNDFAWMAAVASAGPQRWGPDGRILPPKGGIIGGINAILERHPEWGPAETEGLRDLVTSPKKLLAETTEVVVRMLPALAGTMAGGTGQIAAMQYMFAQETGASYENAIASGHSPEDARKISLLYAPGASFIEFMQIGHLARMGKGTIRAMKKRFLGRMLDKVAGRAVAQGAKGTRRQLIAHALRSIALETLAVAAQESLEEIAQGVWEEIVTLGATGRKPEGGLRGFLDRRGTEAVLAFAATLPLGALPASIRLSRVNIDRQIPDLTPVEKTVAAAMMETLKAQGVNTLEVPIEASYAVREFIGKLTKAGVVRQVYYDLYEWEGLEATAVRPVVEAPPAPAPVTQAQRERVLPMSAKEAARLSEADWQLWHDYHVEQTEADVRPRDRRFAEAELDEARGRRADLYKQARKPPPAAPAPTPKERLRRQAQARKAEAPPVEAAAVQPGQAVRFTDPKTGKESVGYFATIQPPDSPTAGKARVHIGGRTGPARVVEPADLRPHDVSALKEGDEVELVGFPESESPASVIGPRLDGTIEVITGTNRKMFAQPESILPVGAEKAPTPRERLQRQAKARKPPARPPTEAAPPIGEAAVSEEAYEDAIRRMAERRERAQVAEEAAAAAPVRGRPRITKEERSRRQKIGRERNTLEREILSYYESETGGNVEAEAREAISGIVGEGEQYGVEFSTNFGGKIPAEITDHFGPGKLPRRYAKYIKGNVPHGRGEETLSALGTEEFLARVEAMSRSKSEVVATGVAEAERWARDTNNGAMLLKIQRYRDLLGGLAGPGTEYIEAADLRAGDTFTVSGDKYVVEETAGGAITVKDGQSGEIYKDQTIPVDPGSLQRAEPEAEPARPPPPERAGEVDLFGRPTFRAVAGKQAGLGIEPGEVAEPAVGAVQVKPELVREAAQVVVDPLVQSPEDLLLAIRADHQAAADAFFNEPANPMPEVREAWIRATKGGALFEEAPEPKGIISKGSYEQAIRRLGGPKVRGGIFPFSGQDVKDAGIIILYHFERGVRKLGDMIKTLTGKMDKRLIRRAWTATKTQRGDLLTAERQAEVAQEPAKRKLRQQIRAIVARKGLPQTEWRVLAKKHGGAMKLTARRMSLADLQNVLAAIKRARPHRIGLKRVITRKTEGKIVSLKAALLGDAGLTEADYARQLAELNITEPRYIEARHFITQTQANELLHKMLEEAPAIRLQEQARRALAKGENAGVQQHVEALEAEVAARREERKVKFKRPRVSQWQSARYFAHRMEALTGLPFFRAWEGMNEQHLENKRAVELYHRRLQAATPEYKNIVKDRAASERVSDYIASKLRRGPRPYPTEITPEEIKLAREVESILEEFRPRVRLARFFEYYYRGVNIPDAKPADLTKAKDIYESQGEAALREHLKGVRWGVIKSGYEPEKILSKAKIWQQPPQALTFGKGDIKVREGPAVVQERTIFQRLDGYMVRMLNLVELRPHAQALIRLFDDHSESFTNPGRVAQSLGEAINEAKGFPSPGNPLARAARRFASTAFRAVFLRPWMSIRNLFQNLAFNEDVALFRFADPRLWHKLSPRAQEYLRTYVDQFTDIGRHYMMLEEKPIPGFKAISRIADKLQHYPHSDRLNRWVCFTLRVNRTLLAFRGVDLTSPGAVKTAMNKAGFATMEPLQQRRALEILAQQDVEAMACYGAWQHTLNVHFGYERAQRSPAEMGGMGRVMGSLFAFPRSWAERIVREGRKVIRGGPYTRRTRAVGRLVQMSVVAYMVGELVKLITGKKRNPYDPANILGWQPGGLAVGAVQEAGKLGYLILRAAHHDRQAFGQVPAQITRCADLFVPFYDIGMNVLEAVSDTKNVDRQAVRELRELIDKEYELRKSAYKADRTFVEKVQKAIFGSEADKPNLVKMAKELSQAKLSDARARRLIRELRSAGVDMEQAKQLLHRAYWDAEFVKPTTKITRRRLTHQAALHRLSDRFGKSKRRTIFSRLRGGKTTP